jgi:ABC-type taurine transport system substrate-binding protein
MTATTSPQLGQIHALLAERGYDVSEPAPDTLKIRETGSGIAVEAVSTSHFQLYEAGGDQVAVSLNNFCKLQDMGPEDEDDILSCVHFLLADVMSARRLLGSLAQ